jgi:hypothetical protein
MEQETGTVAAPLHDHSHEIAPRRALLLILGSSPMIESDDRRDPGLFRGESLRAWLDRLMAVVFTIATTATYVALCVTSSAAAEKVHLGPLERYGEVLSGAFIAFVGVAFLF